MADEEENGSDSKATTSGFFKWLEEHPVVSIGGVVIVVLLIGAQVIKRQQTSGVPSSATGEPATMTDASGQVASYIPTTTSYVTNNYIRQSAPAVAPVSTPTSVAKTPVVNKQPVAVAPVSTPTPVTKVPVSAASTMTVVKPTPPVVAPAGSYVVASGDTLSALAAKWGVSLQAILTANPAITNPNVIKAGQVIKIPPKPVATVPVSTTTPPTPQPVPPVVIPAATPTASAAPARTPTPVATPVHKGGLAWDARYTIKSGDTLSAIAGRYTQTARTQGMPSSMVITYNDIYAHNQQVINTTATAHGNPIKGYATPQQMNNIFPGELLTVPRWDKSLN